MTLKAECWLGVVVSNKSSHPVHVDSLTFSGMMPGDSGSGVLETPMDDGQRKPHQVDQNGDAIFDVDETVDGDAWIELRYQVRYRSDAATCADGTELHEGFPSAHVSAARMPTNVTGSVVLHVRTIETRVNKGNCG